MCMMCGETKAECICHTMMEQEPSLDGFDTSIPQEETPTMGSTKKKKPTDMPLEMAQHQLAPVVALAIHKELGGDMNHKKCLAACAMVRAMYGSVSELPEAQWVELGRESAKVLNTRNNDLNHLDNGKQKITKPDTYFVYMATKLGYLVEGETVGCLKPSDKWLQMVKNNVSVSPSSTRISKGRNDRLRKGMVKSHIIPNKGLRNSVWHLEATSYRVHKESYELLVDTLRAMTDLAKQAIKAEFPYLKEDNAKFIGKLKAHLKTLGCPVDIEFLIEGCSLVVDEEELYSEYDADARGRLYHVMCFGPNPQASDMARAVYQLNDCKEVLRSDKAYDMFIAEMEDISSKKFMKEATIRKVASNPLRAIISLLQLEDDKAIKSPFTYVRMCKDWVEFNDTGKCTVTLGVGLDAKCSGTQYLAMLACDSKMLELTGVTTLSAAQVGSDPYIESANYLNKLLGVDFINRKLIKKAYMAIQYGGGKPAVWDEAVKFGNMMGSREIDTIANNIIVAVQKALGKNIMNLLNNTIQAVLDICKESDKDFFTYKHSDGFMVSKPGHEDLFIADKSFAIRISEGNQVIFGTQTTNEWIVKDGGARTSAEFARTFMVNYIQGLDALVARTFVRHAKKNNLHGITCIHDCFRSQLADAPLMKKVIADTYKEVFVDTDQLAHLREQLTYNGTCYLNFTGINKVTEEVLYSENSYYFCI